MDHRGSVYRLTNDDGNVVFSAEYNAFGEVLDESNAGATNRLGYQSNWLTLKDSGNELVLSPARVYSAKLGRFLQKDLLFAIALLKDRGTYQNSIFTTRKTRKSLQALESILFQKYNYLQDSGINYSDSMGLDKEDCPSDPDVLSGSLGAAFVKSIFEKAIKIHQEKSIPASFVKNTFLKALDIHKGKITAKKKCDDEIKKLQFQKALFDKLPDCPCEVNTPSAWGLLAEFFGIPANFVTGYSLKEEDRDTGLWHEPSWTEQYFSNLAKNHPGAAYCIRSSANLTTLAGQQCCYNKKGELITGGTGAGTPDIYGTSASGFWERLYRVIGHLLTDVAIFNFCLKGYGFIEGTKKYHEVFAPNKGKNCDEREIWKIPDNWSDMLGSFTK